MDEKSKYISKSKIEMVKASALENAFHLLDISVSAYNLGHYGTSFSISVLADEEASKVMQLDSKIEKQQSVKFDEIKPLFKSHWVKHKRIKLLTYSRMIPVYLTGFVKKEIERLKINDPKELKEFVGEKIKEFGEELLNNPGQDLEARIRARRYYYTGNRLEKLRQIGFYVGLEETGIIRGPSEITEPMAREYWLLVYENAFWTDIIHTGGVIAKKLRIKEPPLAIPPKLERT